MKKLVGILLSTVIVFLTIQNTLLYASFKWNQDFITEFLCLDKDKEENTCQGSCHLKEVLEQTNNDTETPLPNFIENETELFFFKCRAKVKSLVQDLSFEKTPASNDVILYFEWINESFHPPKVVV